MKRAIVRLGGYLVWFAALLLALLLAVTFGPTLFGMQSMIVGSGSMGRAMPVGSVALTREIDAKAVAVGDVVSYRRRGATDTTTHRVVGVKLNGRQVIFTTKGDANTANDPESVVVDGDIHRVEHVVPYAGYVTRAVRTPVGGVVAFVVPLVGLMFDRRPKRTRTRPVSNDKGWSSTTLSLINSARTGSRPSG
jgi:signal peptidase